MLIHYNCFPSAGPISCVYIGRIFLCHVWKVRQLHWKRSRCVLVLHTCTGTQCSFRGFHLNLRGLGPATVPVSRQSLTYCLIIHSRGRPLFAVFSAQGCYSSTSSSAVKKLISFLSLIFGKGKIRFIHTTLKDCIHFSPSFLQKQFEGFIKQREKQ